MTTTAPCIIVIFGATGDLAKRKLIPALFRLAASGALHEQTTIIAIGRRQYTDEDIRRELSEFITDKKGWKQFASRITYHHLEFHDADAYLTLKRHIKSDRRIFYLATPPESFPVIIDNLSRAALASGNPAKGWHRVVFEKPFGHDLKSAQQLNKEITTLFSERQIYRIDHYLGKELVQNIMVLRFSNLMFENLWSSKYIDNVQISVLEKQSVGTRGGYYDGAGALRDMVQNHLLQILSLVAMEQPTSIDADDIRDEKVKVLRQLAVPSDARKSVVLGQYVAGTVDDRAVPAYRKENGVEKTSATETYAALKLTVHNTRWLQTPFYLRTGKATGRAYAEVVITFKQTPCILFCGPDGELAPNKLIIRIQPDEGISLQFNLQEQGAEYSALPRSMDFSHKAEFGINTPEAYERLLADVIRGDQTLFTRWDEVEQAWRIIDALRKARVPLQQYKAGSDGPLEAVQLLRRDKRKWHAA